MHEFSICESLVSAVLTEMDKNALQDQRLLKVRVVVGRLRQIVPEYLQQAYEVLTKDTLAESSQLVITSAPVTGKCKDCGWEGELEKGVFLCRQCKSSRAQIVGGMELYLKDMEVDTDD